MTEIMSSVPADPKWGNPCDPEVIPPPGKRPISPTASKPDNYKSQKSVSDVLGPVMDHVHLAGEQKTDAGNLDSALLAEAESLMQDDISFRGVDDDAANTGKDNEAEDSERKDPETVCGEHHVKDLIHEFESRGQTESKCWRCGEDAEVEETVTASTAEDQESILPHVHKLVSKTVSGVKNGVKKVVKSVGHTVIEGVTSGIKKVVLKIHLPQSSLEDNPHNNIHVPHPDKFYAGGMVGLGMNVQRVERGHLVHTVIPDGLAEKAKLEKNDIIISVNDIDVTSWEFEDLQRYFGALEKVEFQLVVERQDGVDENGVPVYNRVTIIIKLSLDGDKVVVDIDVKYTSWSWEYDGESDDYLIFQNRSGRSSLYLSHTDTCFCMTTSFTPSVDFKMLKYSPNWKGPRVLMNVSTNIPVDLSKDTRFGMNGPELYGSGLNILNDSRFFYYQKQLSTGKYVFERTSNANHFLTVGEDGKLTETYFPDVDSVGPSGLFNVVLRALIDASGPSSLVDKSDPTKFQKNNTTDKK